MFLGKMRGKAFNIEKTVGKSRKLGDENVISVIAQEMMNNPIFIESRIPEGE